MIRVQYWKQPNFIHACRALFVMFRVPLWAQIHQLQGCIDLANKNVNNLVNSGLPGPNTVLDPPVFCPFFNALVDPVSGLAGTMQYSIVSDVTLPAVVTLVQNVTADITAVSINPGQTVSINRIYVFTWTAVQASDTQVCMIYLLWEWVRVLVCWSNDAGGWEEGHLVVSPVATS